MLITSLEGDTEDSEEEIQAAEFFFLKFTLCHGRQWTNPALPGRGNLSLQSVRLWHTDKQRDPASCIFGESRVNTIPVRTGH